MQTIFFFIGVTTQQSSIMHIFPRWMAALGRPEVQIQGIDLPLNADPAEYRRVVKQIKQMPEVLGALVTTHKINLLAAARDQFDYLDPNALLCGEVSSLSKRDGALEGHATDPDAGGAALRRILEPGYFGRTGADILCLGAGGSGTAAVVNMLNQPDRVDCPARFVLVDQLSARLDHVQAIIDQYQSAILFELVQHDGPQQTDLLLQNLPPHSLIMNATGLGKDRPGSPLTHGAPFPQHGIVWEFNYRGERQFMQQALAQQAAKDLTIVDGWDYFLVGWIRVIEQVLHISVDEAMFQRLSEIADMYR